MTSLRNFQNTIEEIHNRELAKHKAQAATVPDRDKDLKKKPEKSKASENLRKRASESHSSALDLHETEEKILVTKQYIAFFFLITERTRLPCCLAARRIMT